MSLSVFLGDGDHKFSFLSIKDLADVGLYLLYLNEMLLN